MATLTWYGNGDYNRALIEFGYLKVASEFARSSSKYVVKYPYDTRDIFTGSGLTYKGTYLKSGTIKSFVGVEEGQKTFELKGLSLSASLVTSVAKTPSILDDQRLLKKALAGNDVIRGALGDDALEGFGGNDTLIGNRGADILVGGGGRDTFLFKSIHDTGVALDEADLILDFKPVDRIDLSKIDANQKTAKNDVFKFIGTKNFTNHAGELRFTAFASETVITGDVNGDGKADFSILLDDRVIMKKDYFIL